MTNKFIDEKSKNQTHGNDLLKINYFIVPVFVVAIGAVFLIGWKANALGPLLLWMFASFVAGGTMGFLFGIPKSGLVSKSETSSKDVLNNSNKDVRVAAQTSDRDGAAQRARPNTNLEEVSDWLTKIIVGLALVNLKDLKFAIMAICYRAAESIKSNPSPSDVSMATALVIGFSLIGFLFVYLYMRLFLQGAMARSDDQMMSRYLNAVELAERVGERDSLPDVEKGVPSQVPFTPSAASLNAAQAVADAAPSDPKIVLQPLLQLASEYESLRQQEGYSRDRTRRMADIARRMRPHAIAAVPYIKELMQSNSTGEHLAATVVLQMKYVPEHMEWLARRMVEERAFIGYQAASALLARVRVAGMAECREIQAAVKAAKIERKRLEISEASLDSLIDQILENQ